jgi:hypothetical protein
MEKANFPINIRQTRKEKNTRRLLLARHCRKRNEETSTWCLKIVATTIHVSHRTFSLLSFGPLEFVAVPTKCTTWAVLVLEGQDQYLVTVSAKRQFCEYNILVVIFLVTSFGQRLFFLLLPDKTKRLDKGLRKRQKWEQKDSIFLTEHIYINK